MHPFILTLAILGSGFAAFAAGAEITVHLPVEADVVRSQVEYDCGDRAMTVEYVNAGPVALAVFLHDDEPVVASNVIAASGARYAGGRFVWWTKGHDASLYDLTEGEDAEPVATCRQN